MNKKSKRTIKSLCCSILCTIIISEMPVYALANNTSIETTSSNVNNKRLWYTEPAPIEGDSRVLESKLLPLGNGTIGGGIFGGVEKERIHFNDKTLWTGGPDKPDGTMNNGTPYQGGNKLGEFSQEAYDNIVNRFDSEGELVATGNNTGVSNALFSNRSNLGSWQDFGDIYIDFSGIGSTANNVRNYERDLDLNDATAGVEYDFKGTTYKREYFLSYPDNVLVARFTKDGSEKLNFNVELQKSFALSSSDANVSVDDEDNMIRLIGTLNGNKMNYTSSLKVIAKGDGNKVEEKNNKLQVNNADEVILILSTGTDYKNEYPGYRTGETSKDVTSRVDQVVDEACKKGYDKLKESHTEDYKSLFDRVELDLNESLPNIPTNEILQNYRNGNYNKALEALVFQYGRYLTIASSREGSLPSNLAGLWSIGSPLWAGDYHFNVNVQMNYWPAFSTNLAECGKVFSEYMNSLVIPGRKSAEMSIGAKTEDFENTAIGEGNGFMVHTANNIFGQTSPNGEEYYGWNPNGGTWALQNAFDYYEFTQDKDYLESTLYPMVKEVANMWINQLVESKSQTIDGTDVSRLIVVPSSSAEQGPMTVGSTYDQSLVWEIFDKAIVAANILDTDKEYVVKWQDAQAKLDPINIGEDGQIKEWYKETTIGKYLNGGKSSAIPAFNRDYDGESHRHISNLVGLFPGTLINKDNEKEIEAAKISLLDKGFKATGWSKGHKINLWARTLDGENAYKTVQSMLSTNYAGIMDNLFGSHGFGKDHEDAPAFQVEGNFGYTSGIAEMLLQSQLGYIQFLPAIPSEWSDGRVSGLVARGNFIISEEWQNRFATEFTVQYDGEEANSEFTGEYENIKNAKVYEDGKEINVLKDESNDRITFTVNKGKVYKIDLSNVNSEKIIENAESVLGEIHEDLSKLKEELKVLIEAAKADLNAGVIKELNACMQKTNIVNNMYPKIIECDETVYLISADKKLSQSQIDQYYVDINEIKRRAIENNSNIGVYIDDKSNIQTILSKFNTQLIKNNISFSKDSGGVDINNPSVSLSKQENEYIIRYTTDGTDPVKTSQEYAEAIQLSIENDNVIRAALFKGDQRVSDIFTRKYTNKKTNIKSAVSDNYYNNIDEYSSEKVIDSDLFTRWATNNNTNSVDIELKFDKEEVVSSLKFIQFVSNNNWTDTYKIKALENGEYVTILEGSKLGDIDQKDSDTMAPGSGYYSTKFVEFTPVKTNSIIISMTRCNNPSYFSIDAYNLSTVDVDEIGNAKELNSVIEKASVIDKDDPLYKDAEDVMKKGFDFSLENAKSVTESKQSVMDSRALYLTRYFNRLGFGEADKNELISVIAESEEKITLTEYTKDSVYNLNKLLAKAKELVSSIDAKQPDIEKMIVQLRESMDLLEESLILEKLPLGKGQQEGNWDVVSGGENSGNYYSTTKGSKLTYEFTGNGVEILGVKYSDHGKGKFTLKKDGVVEKEETIDCYSTEREWNRKLISWNDLEIGNYILEIEHVGKNESASNQYVEIKEIVTTNYKEELAVDKSELGNLIELCVDLKEEDFTKESFNNFKVVLEKANDIMASDDTCNAEVKDLIRNLKDAKDSLVLNEVDTTELRERLEIAKSISNNGYTAESFEELQRVIADVEAFLNGEMTTSDAKAKLFKLNNAINNLKADKIELIELYEKNANRDQGKYTDSTWNIFVKALENAKKIIDKVDATPDEVIKAKEYINSAIDGLEEIPDETIVVSKIDNLTSSEVTNSTVKLTWDAPSSIVGLTEYVVYKDGKELAKIPSGNAEIVIDGLRKNINYGFKVCAKYSNGEISKPKSINVRTKK
ncbi:MAG: glycoside hydrolase N-terminal domain-containing protein [Clostridium sp.]